MAVIRDGWTEGPRDDQFKQSQRKEMRYLEILGGSLKDSQKMQWKNDDIISRKEFVKAFVKACTINM